jgi:predicted phage tail protein
MKRVVLRGELGKQFGRIHHFELNTPAEAIRALMANFEDFQNALISSAERGIGYMVQVGKDAINLEQELHYPTASFEEISITPVLVGAGGAVGKIVIGVGLVALSFLLPGAGLFGTTSLFGVSAAGATGAGVVAGGAFLTAVGTVTSAIGAALILSGTSQLLSPAISDAPGTFGSIEGANRFASIDSRNNEPADNRTSYIFNGAVNVTAQGAPVPICYGRMRVGSVVISAGVTTTDI